MISVDSNSEEANADLVLRRTQSVRSEEKKHQQKSP